MNSENYANDELDEIINSSDIGADNADKVKSAAKKYSDRLNKDRERIRGELSTDYLSALSKALGVDVKSFTAEDLKSAIDNAISQNETVKNANEVLKENEAKKVQEVLNENVNKIKSVNASIKSLDDVCKLDKYADIQAKVDKGYDLYDAYISVYGFPTGGDTPKRVSLDSRTVSYVKPETMSDGEFAIYKKAFPNKTPEEILAMYRRDTK